MASTNKLRRSRKPVMINSKTKIDFKKNVEADGIPRIISLNIFYAKFSAFKTFM